MEHRRIATKISLPSSLRNLKKRKSERRAIAAINSSSILF